MPRAASRLVIEGHVQGVGFRWWAVEAARRLGLTGWVRNRRDGSVEALAVGEAAALAYFAEACRRGPPAAEVLKVQSEPAEDDGSTSFEQWATA